MVCRVSGREGDDPVVRQGDLSDSGANGCVVVVRSHLKVGPVVAQVSGSAGTVNHSWPR